MDIRTLGIVVTGGAGDASALVAARALAARWGARVDAVALAVEPVAIEAVTVGAVGLMARARDEALAEAASLAARARSALGERASVEPMALTSPGTLDGLGRRLRFADLLVTGRPMGPGRGGLAAVAVEAALFQSGVPVLAVPDAGADLEQPWARVMLAWDDGAAALAAARSALPVLREARAVDLACVGPVAGEVASGEAALWLAQHAGAVEAVASPRGAETVAAALARLARERGAGALVMGAYGHSRLREAVLGGVTREMLSTVPLPLWLAR